VRYFLRTRWVLLALLLAFLALPAVAAAKQQASLPGEGGGGAALQAPAEPGAGDQANREASSHSLIAASFFLLVFILIALANLAIFRSGRQRWRKGAGLSSGGGFGGFGGGFSGFGSDAARARETGFLR
jgi:alkylation response protein AidB-like acyl-CoA dehydrogenase